jgi:hypothetical protein
LRSHLRAFFESVLIAAAVGTAMAVFWWLINFSPLGLNVQTGLLFFAEALIV